MTHTADIIELLTIIVRAPDRSLLHENAINYTRDADSSRLLGCRFEIVNSNDDDVMSGKVLRHPYIIDHRRNSWEKGRMIRTTH
mgnify:CR=1 FL=1